MRRAGGLNPSRRKLALALTIIALDAAAAASLALPAARGQVLAAAAMSQELSVPELAVVLQSRDNSCGPAAVATLASWLGAGATEAEVMRRAALTPAGISLAEFARLAAAFGIAGAWYHVAPSALSRLPTPFAAHLDRSGRGHFVLVLTVKGSLALIADPASGAHVAPVAHLAREFSGRAFLVRGGGA